MSESGDYTPAPYWEGHDFSDARATYDVNAGRSYERAQAAGDTASKLLPDEISTESDDPALIDVDFTGSMDGWDATMFSKFPYFEHEVRTEYLSKDAEMSFGAIADSSDEYPLQIRPFAKGAGLKKTLPELVHAGGGGGSDHYCEAHGLAMLYRLHNTKMPRALRKPPYIIITDEMAHHVVTPEQAWKLAKVRIKKSMGIGEIVSKIKEMYEFYIILKPYSNERLSGDKLPPDTQMVYNFWVNLIGADHIALLPDPNRVVDVIFGILAKITDRVAYFREELEARQLPDKGGKQKVEAVYKSLETIHKLLPAPEADRTQGHSKTRGLGGGKPTKSLLD